MLESSTPFDSNDILTRKYKRPARRVVPTLSRVSLLPGSELKETFSSRLRPEDELPDQIKTGDGTDRLLAHKKPERRQKKSDSGGAKKAQAQPAEQKKEKRKKAQLAKNAKAVAGTNPHPNKRRKHPEKKGGQSAQKAVAPATEPVNGQQSKGAKGGKVSGKGKQSPNQRQKAAVQSGQPGKRRQRPPRPPQPVNRSRQKDSTEQASLMRPYYLSDLKKH